MPRIAPVEPPYSEEVQAAFEKLMPLGMEPLRLFRTVAHNPRVLRRLQRGGLLDPGSISVRQRELVILRTCALTGADYEWSVHAAIFSGTAGFDSAELDATAGPIDAGQWRNEEAAILRMCDALHETSTVDDELIAQLKGHFDDAQIVELVMLAGLYHAVSFIVNVSGCEREGWSPPMPRREPSA